MLPAVLLFTLFLSELAPATPPAGQVVPPGPSADRCGDGPHLPKKPVVGTEVRGGRLRPKAGFRFEKADRRVRVLNNAGQAVAGIACTCPGDGSCDIDLDGDSAHCVVGTCQTECDFGGVVLGGPPGKTAPGTPPSTPGTPGSPAPGGGGGSGGQPVPPK